MKLETFFELSNSDISLAHNVAYVIYNDLRQTNYIQKEIDRFYSYLDPSDFGATWDNNPYGVESELASGSGCWDTSKCEDEMYAKAKSDLANAIKEDGVENYLGDYFDKYGFDYEDSIDEEILKSVGELVIKELEA